jgi:ABC-type uncharacterized transport system substrate-binding protein
LPSPLLFECLWHTIIAVSLNYPNLKATSLNRPGGNVTGVNFLATEITAKRFELLRELLPKATETLLLVNPDAPLSEAERQRVEAAAQVIGHEVLSFDANRRLLGTPRDKTRKMRNS